MNKNIIFFDIDGTIISEEDSSIPDSALTAINTARKNGNLLFINTGRTPAILPKVLREIGFDGYICGCGTYIEYNNNVLINEKLEKSLIIEIIKSLKDFKLEGIIEGDNKVYFDKHENLKNELVHKIYDSQSRDDSIPMGTWDDPNIEASKFVIFINDDSEFDPFYNKFKDKFDFIKRDEYFYEIVPTGYSKATGIKFIIDKLEIPFENTFAIGDSTNDLSMLEYVQNSIAMGNSNPALFPLVSYTTTSLENDGIYNALSHYKII